MTPDGTTPSGRRKPTPYNPLDKIHLGESVARAVLAEPTHPLPPSPRFDGAGVYIIYYTGRHPAYARLSERNQDGRFEAPIYIGKAVPAGARKGMVGLGVDPGPELYNRLRQHAKSIREAINLENEQFFCRYIVVEDIWIPLGESLLIQTYRPPWNVILEGFGNNDPGQGRYDGMMPSWDVVHPGRAWATRCQPNPRSSGELIVRVQAALSARWPDQPSRL